jgi:hypothetical protein
VGSVSFNDSLPAGFGQGHFSEAASLEWNEAPGALNWRRGTQRPACGTVGASRELSRAPDSDSRLSSMPKAVAGGFSPPFRDRASVASCCGSAGGMACSGSMGASPQSTQPPRPGQPPDARQQAGGAWRLTSVAIETSASAPEPLPELRCGNSPQGDLLPDLHRRSIEIPVQGGC